MSEENEQTNESHGTEGTRAPDVTGDGQQPDPGRTFTQVELNAIIADRITRERAKYADYDELQKAKAELDELRQAQMSELEKAQAQVAEMEAERDRALERATETLIRSAFVAEAARAGVVHPEDAFLLAEMNGVDVSEDGNVSGVAEIVKALIEAGRLVMAGKQRAPNLDGGAGGGDRQDDKPVVLSNEELQMAQKLGVTPEAYAKHKKKH